MIDANKIIQLRKDIESSVGRSICSPTDFTFLSDTIYKKCKETISASTLKRIWGYMTGYQTIRTSTLSILCHCIGYPDWESYKKYGNQSTSSQFVLKQTLSASDLPENAVLYITWAPNRRCSFLHLGSGRFKVQTSENSKLQYGDTFVCQLFVLGEPLFLDQFIRNNEEPAIYTIGRQGGISQIRVVQDYDSIDKNGYTK